MKEQKIGSVLRFSQKELARLFETGEAQIVHRHISLNKTLKEFCDSPHTSELYSRAFKAIWRTREMKLLMGYKTKLDLSVSPCPYTNDQIIAVEKAGRRLGYLPKAICSKKDRQFMGLLWPRMLGSSTSIRNDVTNEFDRYGWFDYETSITPPYPGSTEQELREIAKAQNLFGMNLNEYIVASQDSKLFAGKYFDQTDKSSTRLFASHDDDRGRRIDVDFDRKGGLFIIPDRDSELASDYLGGRLIGFPH